MMYVAPGNRLKSGGKKGVGLRKPPEVKVRVPQRLLKDSGEFLLPVHTPPFAPLHLLVGQ